MTGPNHIAPSEMAAFEALFEEWLDRGVPSNRDVIELGSLGQVRALAHLCMDWAAKLSVAQTRMTMGSRMDLNEVLCRAWIACDPNRAGAEKGSGFHPDDVEPDALYTSGVGESGELITEKRDNPRAGQPYWKWFEPRAKALREFLEEHGYTIVRDDIPDPER